MKDTIRFTDDKVEWLRDGIVVQRFSCIDELREHTRRRIDFHMETAHNLEAQAAEKRQLATDAGIFLNEIGG